MDHIGSGYVSHTMWYIDVLQPTCFLYVISVLYLLPTIILKVSEIVLSKYLNKIPILKYKLLPLVDD